MGHTAFPQRAREDLMDEALVGMRLHSLTRAYQSVGRRRGRVTPLVTSRSKDDMPAMGAEVAGQNLPEEIWG